MRTTPYQKYLLAVLSLILAFNYVDRIALGLLLQDIKIDLELSDSQLGLLSGIAFAFFYSILGIPIARWADRGNRVTVVAITTSLWSASVVLCGAAGSFFQLLAIRICVAVGESGCIPVAQSIIADYFLRAERARAISIYMLGGSLSYVIGYLLAGWLNELYGWRITFMLLGLPGVPVAALAWFTLREPRLSKGSPATLTESYAAMYSSELRGSMSSSTHPSMREVFRTLWVISTFRYLLFAFSVLFFFSYGINKWLPTFFIRSHGVQTGELGIWFAAIWGLGGLVGTYWGGRLASHTAANNERLQLRVMAIVYGGIAIISPCIYLTSNRYLAFAQMGLVAVGTAVNLGPLFAIVQTLVPGKMRAMSIALIYLFANLIGMGIGPFAAGALSDALKPLLGEESLRYSLMALSPGYLLCGWCLLRASGTVARDLHAIQVDGESGAGSDDESMSPRRFHKIAVGRLDSK